MYFGGPAKSCSDSSDTGGGGAAEVVVAARFCVSGGGVSSMAMEREESEQNLKATELRLGLPGARSPVRSAPPVDELGSASASSSATSELCLLSTPRRAVVEKKLFPDCPGEENPLPEKYPFWAAPGNYQVKKRGFSEAMENRKVGFSGQWVFPGKPSPSPVAVQAGSADVEASKAKFKGQMASPKGVAPTWQGESAFGSVRGSSSGKGEAGCSKDVGAKDSQGQSQITAEAPVSKQQVVGWPPVRSFRCKTLATNPKPVDESEKPGSNALYIKVSMDGAPYLRKVDLKMYSRYQELSSALEKMFRCFTIGQCGSHGIPGRDGLSESKLMDLLHGSEYVLTYEDKDGDWMLVGDVPWEMFVDSCKRLRIMKGSEAIGLAPRAMEKCKNRS